MPETGAVCAREKLMPLVHAELRRQLHACRTALGLAGTMVYLWMKLGT